MVRSTIAKTGEISRNWHVIDAGDKILGRLASEIAMILMGKDKPIYTPFVDTGDFVIVVNAEKIALTGKKLDNKLYRSYSGYIGGLKETNARRMLEKKPEYLIWHAVKGMLPKNRLSDRLITKLKIYKGEAHPHEAQKPKLLELDGDKG